MKTYIIVQSLIQWFSTSLNAVAHYKNLNIFAAELHAINTVNMLKILVAHRKNPLCN